MFNIIKFGANMAKLRKSADMTQFELADKINLTRQAVSKYERGESFPDISILSLISEVFGVSVESLIRAGEATENEAKMLLHLSTENDLVVEEVINLAPFLKPSVLDKLAEKLKKQDIDISGLVTLSEYMNSKSITELLKNAELDVINAELFEKLLPFVSNESFWLIFDKILSGKLDWHFIKIFLPYANYLWSYIEAAVIEGALPLEVLEFIRNQ